MLKTCRFDGTSNYYLFVYFFGFSSCFDSLGLKFLLYFFTVLKQFRVSNELSHAFLEIVSTNTQL